ncbi:hypothetical protein [Pseudoxanthomonas sp.]|uniref:hypothetical protein n=1 Tax=Pseudoxanthomonas sp. TaxID=1871049 RepID=UPI003F7F4FE6
MAAYFSDYLIYFLLPLLVLGVVGMARLAFTDFHLFHKFAWPAIWVVGVLNIFGIFYTIGLMAAAHSASSLIPAKAVELRAAILSLAPNLFVLTVVLTCQFALMCINVVARAAHKRRCHCHEVNRRRQQRGIEEPGAH